MSSHHQYKPGNLLAIDNLHLLGIPVGEVENATKDKEHHPNWEEQVNEELNADEDDSSGDEELPRHAHMGVGYRW